MIAQVVKRYERRRVVAVERRIVEGTPARVETLRRRSQGDGVINTAYIERLNATFRERLAALTRRGRALTRHTLTLHHGMYLIGTVYNFCTAHTSLAQAGGTPTPAMAAGITDHCWSVHELLTYRVPPTPWTPPKQRGRPSQALKRLIERWCVETTVRCGATVKLAAATIRCVSHRKRGKARLFPVESLKHIVVAGSAQFNSELLAFLGKRGVRLSFLDYYGNFSGSLEVANPHTAGAVHLAQAAIILDTERRLTLAKHILSAALHNLLANLRYYSYRRNVLLKPTVTAIQKHMQNLQEVHSVEQMMGCEGLARQEYYAAWQHINPALAIARRTRRPPTDRINALISFCNGLVYSLCKNELAKTHLDMTLSFIHAPTQTRASLALDLAEIF